MWSWGKYCQCDILGGSHEENSKGDGEKFKLFIAIIGFSGVGEWSFINRQGIGLKIDSSMSAE